MKSVSHELKLPDKSVTEVFGNNNDNPILFLKKRHCSNLYLINIIYIHSWVVTYPPRITTASKRKNQTFKTKLKMKHRFKL